MATLYEWYQTTLNFLKDNKVLLLLVTASVSTNIYQASSVETTSAKTKVETKACDCNIKQHLREHH